MDLYFSNSKEEEETDFKTFGVDEKCTLESSALRYRQRVFHIINASIWHNIYVLMCMSSGKYVRVWAFELLSQKYLKILIAGNCNRYFQVWDSQYQAWFVVAFMEMRARNKWICPRTVQASSFHIHTHSPFV